MAVDRKPSYVLDEGVMQVFVLGLLYWNGKPIGSYAMQARRPLHSAG